MLNVDIDENAWDSQETRKAELVGSEFKPGTEGNSQIEVLLGFESEVFGEHAYRRIEHKHDVVQWELSPDYCGDDALALEMMEIREVMSFVLHQVPSVSKRKPKVPAPDKFIVVMDIGEQLYTTPPHVTRQHAAACALFGALLILSHE